MALILVPATVTRLEVLDPGEFRVVELTLPPAAEVDGTMYPVVDDLRAGTAFLAEPMGARTRRPQKRLYTRSNVGLLSPRVLQTVINRSHEDRADTSIWWQTEEVRLGTEVPVRVELDDAGEALRPYEHRIGDDEKNLKLEPDAWWRERRFLGLAFGTGLTPLVAHLRYMAAMRFGRSARHRGAHYSLVLSVRNPRQLMFHEELLGIRRAFPEHFDYHPVLTREWPGDWAYGTGRVVRTVRCSDGLEVGDVSALLERVPDLETRHVRMCGGKACERQLREGFERLVRPASFKAEVW